MAMKYCEKHTLWYDYKEGGCPECMKIPRMAVDIVSTAVVATVGGLILGGKKIHEKIKEDEIKKIEDENRTIRSRIFCSRCGNKIFGNINFYTKCGAKL